MKVKIIEVVKKVSKFNPQEMYLEIKFKEPLFNTTQRVFINQKYMFKLKKPLTKGMDIEVVKRNKKYEIKYIYYN